MFRVFSIATCLHKIICNRSIANLKMGNYKNAERDAQLCIDSQPGFVKVTNSHLLPPGTFIHSSKFINEHSTFCTLVKKVKIGHVNILILINAPGRRQWKTSILSTNIDKKLLETEFLIAICRPNGDKWQSKTLFLEIFDQSVFVKCSECFRLPPAFTRSSVTVH